MLIHMIILFSYAIAWCKHTRDASTTVKTNTRELTAETFFDDTIEEYLNSGNESTSEECIVVELDSSE